MTTIHNATIRPYSLADDGIIPNSPLPLLIYQSAIKATDLASAFEATFAQNNWPHSWRNSIYAFHHYHSTAHEVLGIAEGTADVQMGGPNGVQLTVNPGDVVIIPAGVGHKNLSASPDLLVIGSYPTGQSPDLFRESKSEHQEALQNIPRVPLPTADPVYGADGPMLRHWKR